MSYGGSRSSAASSGRATTRTSRAVVPARPPVGGAADRAAARRSTSSSTTPPVDALDARVPAAAHHRPPAGLVQHRRADRRLQLAAAPRRGARAVAPRTPSELGVTDGDRVRVISRRGEVVAPVRVDHALRAGLAFMTLHFPDEVATNVLTINNTDPKSGTAEFKATRHPRRAARSRRARGRRRTPPTGDARRPAPLMDIVLGDDDPTGGRARGRRRRARPARQPLGGRAHHVRPRPRVARGGHAARAQRHLLLPVFHAVQSRAGWISPGALNYICQRLTIPPAEAYGVATFYALFSLEPQPPAVAHVCNDIACLARRAKQLCADLEARLGPTGGQRGRTAPGPARTRSGSRARASGCASRRRRRWSPSPARSRASVSVGHAAADGVAALLAGGDAPRAGRPEVPQAGGPRAAAPAPRRPRRSRRASTATARTAATRRCAPRSTWAEQGVLREVTDAKLLGRGGAAFPTGRKWEAVARAPDAARTTWSATPTSPSRARSRTACSSSTTRSRHRGDDDRRLRDRLRARLPLPARRVPAGLGAPRRSRHRQRATRGFLGDDILGRGMRLRHRAAQGRRRVHLRRGDGALQLDRGLPRRAAQQAAVPGRARPVRQADGDQQRRDAGQRAPASCSRAARPTRRIGTADSTGTRLFCLSGSVARPGLYEAPFGITLRELLELAGGVRGGRAAAGRPARRRRRAFVDAGRARRELTFEATRAAGATLGSGVVMVVRRHRRPAGDPAADRRVLPRRVVRAVRALPRRDRAPGGGARAAADGHARGTSEDEYALLDEIGAGDARRVDLRPRPDGRRRDRVGAAQARRLRDRRAAMSRTRHRSAAAHRRARARRRARSQCPRGPDDPRACAGAGHRHPDDVLGARRSRR